MSPKTVAADNVAICNRVLSVPEMSEMQRNDNHDMGEVRKKTGMEGYFF